MRAVYFEQYGGPEVVSVRDIPNPRIRPGRILIRVHAASLNRSDWEALTAKPSYVRMSGNGFLRPRRTGLGSDIAGVVEAVGDDVGGWAPGDRVFGDLLWTGPATLAELADPPANAPLARIPDGVDFNQAAALPQAAGLAWQGLTEGGEPTAGDHILLFGAGGGAGSMAIQIAKHFGAEVTAVDSAPKLEFMLSLGADHVVDYRAENVYRRGQKYNRVLDFVGKRSVFSHRRALASGGTYRMVGGSVPRILELVTAGSLLSAASDRSMRMLMAKPNPADLAAIAELVAQGAINPAIDHVYPLDEAPEALRRLGAAEQLGKLVIAI